MPDLNTRWGCDDAFFATNVFERITVRLQVFDELIGVILGSGGPPSTWTVASLGFLGGFTTFSTWMLETVRFGVVQGLRMRAVLNLIGQLLIGVILVTLGYTLGG